MTRIVTTERSQRLHRTVSVTPAHPPKECERANGHAPTKRVLELSQRLDRRASESAGPVTEQTGFVSGGLRGRFAGGTALPWEVVRADQRVRLTRAVVSVAAARGYAAVTVREVVRRAGVSQKTVYANFAGLADILLTACDEALEWVLGGFERAVAGEARWPDGVREGLRCLLERLASKPELARCCFVELCALGSPGEECRLRAIARLAAALRPPGAQASRGRGLNVGDELVAGGVWHAIEAAVLAREEAGLVSLLPALHWHVVLRCRDGRGQGERRRDA